MAGSTLGTILKITTWGESHGDGLGVIVDGCPAGLSLCEEDIQKFLDRRRPGQNDYTTPRQESDAVSILSGVFEGKTTGTPISLIVYNKDQRSRDYSDISSYYRPGHADQVYDTKYGFRDYRGGGRSSGRETIGRVAAGAIASKLLSELGINICAYTKSIGSVTATTFDINEIINNPFYMADANAACEARKLLDRYISEGDSVGGVVECVVKNLPAGLGEPVFEKLDANLAKAIVSIGAVKGFEMGNGMGAATSTGRSNNDALNATAGKIAKVTNNAGGILGGISDGSDLILRAAFKPTPSISATQSTVNTAGDNIDINIKGRHDPIIVPRAVVVVEAMTALTIADALLVNMGSQMDYLWSFYNQ